MTSDQLLKAVLALMANAILVQGDVHSMQCQTTKLVVYKVTFSTFWDREKFPKQYPEFRPPAQWTKLIGFSHRPEYHLFRLGESASLAVKEFAEKGTTEVLDKTQVSAYYHDDNDEFVVLDGFSAPPIETGVGSSQASIFLDGNHTRVSVMSKMVPSPDWFVGLDSLNLCENGHFVDSVTVEADPMDAGTDNGFTFTSPNWPTSPQGSIFRITNSYPAHPAGSFNYPEKSSLPTIATFTFVKEKEFELSEVFDQPQPEQAVPMTRVNKYAYSVDDDEQSNDIVSFVANHETTSERQLMSNEIPERPADDDDDLLSAVTMSGKIRKFRSGGERGYHASTGPGDFMKKKYLEDDLYMKLMDQYEEKKKSGLTQDLSKRLKRKRRLRRLRHGKNRSKKHRTGPVNCKVGKWSEWSPCSKTCGIGEAKRTREVIREAKRGGNECPPLMSMRWCGSARNRRLCQDYRPTFDWTGALKKSLEQP